MRINKMNKSIKIFLIILTMVSLVIVSGCSTNSGITGGGVADMEDFSETGDVKEVTIESFNFGFKQTGDEIVAGDTVKLTVTSTSGVHGISFPGLGITIQPLGPGESKTVEFVAQKSGEFGYHCNIMCGPGYMEMVG